MATEILHHTHPVALHKTLNRTADIPKSITWLYSLDSLEQGFVGHFDQTLGFTGQFARRIHPAGVAEPAVHNHSHINV